MSTMRLVMSVSQSPYLEVKNIPLKQREMELDNSSGLNNRDQMVSGLDLMQTSSLRSGLNTSIKYTSVLNTTMIPTTLTHLPYRGTCSSTTTQTYYPTEITTGSSSTRDLTLWHQWTLLTPPGKSLILLPLWSLVLIVVIITIFSK